MLFHQYIAQNNTEAVQQFLIELGYDLSHVQQQPERCIAHYITNHNDISPLLKLHPDLAMLQESLAPGGQSVSSSAKLIQHPASQAAPATGMPATGMPATGMPATGMPATGMPATGMPATGMPARRPYHEFIKLPITQNDLINLALVLLCAFLLTELLKK